MGNKRLEQSKEKTLAEAEKEQRNNEFLKSVASKFFKLCPKLYCHEETTNINYEDVIEGYLEGTLNTYIKDTFKVPDENLEQVADSITQELLKSTNTLFGFTYSRQRAEEIVMSNMLDHIDFYAFESILERTKHMEVLRGSDLEKIKDLRLYGGISIGDLIKDLVKSNHQEMVNLIGKTATPERSEIIKLFTDPLDVDKYTLREEFLNLVYSEIIGDISEIIDKIPTKEAVKEAMDISEADKPTLLDKFKSLFGGADFKNPGKS